MSGFIPNVNGATKGNGPLAGQTDNFNFSLINFDWTTWHNYDWENWVQLDALLQQAIGYLNLKGIWRPAKEYTVNEVVLDPLDVTQLYRATATHTSGTVFETDKQLYWDLADSADPLVTSVFGRAGAVTAQEGDYSSFYPLLEDFNTLETDFTEHVNLYNTHVTNVAAQFAGLGDLAARDTVAGSHIDNNAVTTAKVANDAITGAKIASSAVGTQEIANGAVTNAKIANDAINADKIANDSINSEHYVDNSINTQHIAAQAVNASKLAPNAALQNIGFTPVQQGGGPGQLGDKINIGFAGEGQGYSLAHNDVLRGRIALWGDAPLIPIGNTVRVVGGAGAPYTLPAGGQWLVHLIQIRGDGERTFLDTLQYGVFAGGTVFAAPPVNVAWVGGVWKVI